MGIPSLTPPPLVLRGSTSLQLRPRPALGAGSLFSLKVKDPVSGHAQHFVVGDILRVKAWNGTSIIDNWLRVDAQTNPGAGEGYWKYDVTRVSGTAGLIIAGTTVVNYGQSGQGFISLSSDGTIGSSPNITIGKHSGQPWVTTTILSRIGNLNGSYGQATNVYGAGIGDYSGGNYLLYNGTTFVLKGGDGQAIIDSNGITLQPSSDPSGLDPYSMSTGAYIGWHRSSGTEIGRDFCRRNSSSGLRERTTTLLVNSESAEIESAIIENDDALPTTYASLLLQGASSTGNMYLTLLDNSIPISFRIGNGAGLVYIYNTVETFKITTGKSVVTAGAALATNTTDGFLYVPTCAGAPSGTPTTQTGTCALIYDTSNNKLYVYNGAWKQVTLA